MKPKTKKVLLISLVVLALGAGAIVIWMKQPPTVTVEDTRKAEEVAADEDLMNAIESGTSDAEDTTEVEADED